ncbi:MAG TPA: hypothetical protein VGK86_08085 [Thermoanaerobaculia bacterium]
MAVHLAKVLLLRPLGELLTAGERKREKHRYVEPGGGERTDQNPTGGSALSAREENEGRHDGEKLGEAESQKSEDPEDCVALEVEVDMVHGRVPPNFYKDLCIAK